MARLRPVTFNTTTNDVMGFDAANPDEADSQQRIGEVGLVGSSSKLFGMLFFRKGRVVV